jgi:hypothetical protein
MKTIKFLILFYKLSIITLISSNMTYLHITFKNLTLYGSYDSTCFNSHWLPQRTPHLSLVTFESLCRNCKHVASHFVLKVGVAERLMLELDVVTLKSTSNNLPWTSKQHCPKIDLSLFYAMSSLPLPHRKSNPNTKPPKWWLLKSGVLLPFHFLSCEENAMKVNDIMSILHMLLLRLIWSLP